MLWPNGSQSKPYVSSAFGPRNINVPNASKNHKGTDFSHTFSIIRAVASGQVKVAGTPQGWSGGGVQVWVQHDGFFSKSLHSSGLLVKVGQFVREGDPLCVMGRTGTASDVHLHLEITRGNIHYSNTGQVDPVAFISNRVGSPAGGESTTPEDDMFSSDDASRLVNIHTRIDDTVAILEQWLPALASQLSNVQADASNTFVRVRGTDPYGDMLQLILGKLGVPVEAQIDTQRLARELAPLLDSAIDEMTDEEIDRISKRVNDVRDQRERDRLAS